MDGPNPQILLRGGHSLRTRETISKANALQLRHHPSPTNAVPDALDMCGFISGNPDYPLTCHPGQRCAKDPVRSLVACCWAPAHGTCIVSTRCLDQSQSQLENVFDGLDMVCFDGRAPYCKTDILSGDPELTGYSLFICDTDKIPDTILRYTTTPSISSNKILSTTINVPDSHNVSTTGDNINLHATPASTIVGAVVGCIGALAITSASIWALLQLKRCRRNPPAAEKPLKSNHGINASPGPIVLPTELPPTQPNHYIETE